MDLMFGTELAPEKRQSYVGEYSRLRCPGCPIFAVHDAEISCLGAEQDTLAFPIVAGAVEPGATGYPAFEVVDVRRLQFRAGRLVVAAVHIQPWYWKWPRRPVRIDMGSDRRARSALSPCVPAWQEQRTADRTASDTRLMKS